MAITLQETFQVRAPIEDVWRFVLDPQQVTGCMPGAELEEIVDERTFLGSIAVKAGAITASYKGRVEFVRLDEEGYAVAMVAEGRERGGGTATGTMSSRLRSVADGETEVTVEAAIEITGRIAQMGRGMIEGVSRQLFQQFVACAKARLEAPGATAGEPPANKEPIRILPLVLSVLWSAAVRLFRRVLRRAPT